MADHAGGRGAARRRPRRGGVCSRTPSARAPHARRHGRRGGRRRRPHALRRRRVADERAGPAHHVAAHAVERRVAGAARGARHGVRRTWRQRAHPRRRRPPDVRAVRLRRSTDRGADVARRGTDLEHGLPHRRDRAGRDRLGRGRDRGGDRDLGPAARRPGGGRGDPGRGPAVLDPCARLFPQLDRHAGGTGRRERGDDRPRHALPRDPAAAGGRHVVTHEHRVGVRAARRAGGGPRPRHVPRDPVPQRPEPALHGRRRRRMRHGRRERPRVAAAAAVSAGVQALHRPSRRRAAHRLLGQRDAARLLVVRHVHRHGIGGGAEGPHLDEQPRPLSRRDLLPEPVLAGGSGRRTGGRDDRPPGGGERGLADPLRRVRARLLGHARPLRRHVHAVRGPARAGGAARHAAGGRPDGRPDRGQEPTRAAAASRRRHGSAPVRHRMAAGGTGRRPRDRLRPPCGPHPVHARRRRRLARRRDAAGAARGPHQGARHRGPQHAPAARRPHERDDAG